MAPARGASAAAALATAFVLALCGAPLMAGTGQTDTRVRLPAGAGAAAAPLEPLAPLPEGVAVLAQNPPAADPDRAAVAAVVELQAALLRAEHGGDADAVLARALPGSPAAAALAEHLAEDRPAPVGRFVFHHIAVGRYTADLVQIDACLDRTAVVPAPAEPVQWTGYTLRREGEGWRAAAILTDPVGPGPDTRCGG
ncbi:hypothetical protein LG943_22955 [Streptomonospora sp. S1-112]|uniref:Secreted protein n=1 Tax=Streptomonospora mangrovi TaxID=2883123 RepID=A0A9X3NUK1_9ACTN|nr:hypothetical protein [Streptomonospora mangrovi]MDA0567155.1 hypothetical protein [Streptomonospora mangrovi]